jgi:hypothetical protein
MDARVLPQRLGRRQQVELHTQPDHWMEHFRRRQHHASSQFGGLHACQV